MDYGFGLPDSINESFYESFKERYMTDLKRRKRRWDLFYIDSHTSKSTKLKRFIRKGIPIDLREQVWMKYSGAEERMKSNPNVYATLLEKEIEPAISQVISADVHRTYPDNVHFQKIICKSSESNLLKNILKAFAAQNPYIGYCQGLNYIAALIILIVSTEEKCFWLFDTIVTKIVAPYYNPDMKSVMIDGLVLEELLRMKSPLVYKCLKKMDTSCIAMCTKWFVCLFVDVLPIETTIRVMDCIIYEGDKILFRVALSLIKLNTKQFLASKAFPDFAICFRNIVCNESVVECHSFIQKVFKLSNPLPYRRIKRLRKNCERKLGTLNFIT